MLKSIPMANRRTCNVQPLDGAARQKAVQFPRSVTVALVLAEKIDAAA